MPVTKTAQAIARFQAGDIQGALRLAKGFRLGITRAERAQLARAYECFIRPDFYAQLGYCPKHEIELGTQTFSRLFLPTTTDNA